MGNNSTPRAAAAAAGPSMPLGVTENTMTGIITVTPATDGGGVITSTADDVRDALSAVRASGWTRSRGC